MENYSKVAVVTAATRGIGWAIAENLAEKNVHVYIASIPQELEDAAEKIKEANEKYSGRIDTLVYDAHDINSYEPMFKKFFETEDKIDILVNNYGTSNRQIDLDIEHIKYDDFSRFVDINYASVMLPIQLCLENMKKNGGGSIINIGSIAATVPDMTMMAYGVAKAGICQITKMAALQLAEYGIRCNAVLPGITATDAVQRSLTPEYKAGFLRHVPLGKMNTPEEVAQSVCYFANDASGCVTGQILEISGGYGLGTPMYADMMYAKTMKMKKQ